MWLRRLPVILMTFSFQQVFAQTVAVLDTGLNAEVAVMPTSSRLSGQLCFSEQDDYVAVGSNTDARQYYKASLCKNGQAKDTAASNNPATHPRQLFIGGAGPSKYLPLGGPLTHGNAISTAIYSFNSTVRHKHVQTYWFDTRLSLIGSNHFCELGFYNRAECYTITNPGKFTNNIQEALVHLANNPTGISSVVIATTITSSTLEPSACRLAIGQNEVDRLYSKGVAVVAALDNRDFSSGKKSWPNCLDKVINVARTGSGAGAGVGANGIKYFALGTSGSSVGNSFAAPRVAAAFALLHNARPTSTVADKITALNRASTLTYTHNGYTRRYIKSNQISNAISILTSSGGGGTGGDGGGGGGGTNTGGPPPPTPSGSTAILGYTNDTYYRNGFAKFIVALSGTPYNAKQFDASDAASKSSIRVTDIRDIELTFQGKFATAHNPASLQGVDIWVNGRRRHYFHTINHSADSVQILNLPYRNYSFMLNRNWLRNGDNTIEIRQRNMLDQMYFGIKNISMDYNPPIRLSVGNTNIHLYGHRVGSRRHLTGLRAEFTSSGSDMEFTATGYDIDSATEIAVFLNYRLIGYLPRSGSDRYSQPHTFLLAKEWLVGSGINTLEFVQTSSSDSEKWGIRNMLLDAKKLPVITGALLLLLGDD